MITTRTLFATLLTTALLPGFAFAQREPGSSQTPGAGSQTSSSRQASGQSGQHVRLSELTGANVQSTQGENVGNIEEIVVDPKTGQIQFAVIGMGGFLGIGEKNVPVPWQLLKPAGEKRFQLNADKQKLQGAPSLREEQYSQLGSSDFASRIYSHFGVQPPSDVGGTGAGQLGTEKGKQQQPYQEKNQLDRPSPQNGNPSQP